MKTNKIKDLVEKNCFSYRNEKRMGKNEAYRGYFKRRNISQEITDRFTIWLIKQNTYKKDFTETEISENRGCWFWQSAHPQKKKHLGKKIIQFTHGIIFKPNLIYY